MLPVCEGCKVTIWKQFTTADLRQWRMCPLFVKGAKLQFESNSQRWPFPFPPGPACLWRVQSYNLKAIHNHLIYGISRKKPVCEGCKVTIWKQFTTQASKFVQIAVLFVKGAKLQFESNSQPSKVPTGRAHPCLWRVQSYNLKAIHNWLSVLWFGREPVCEGCKVTIWKQFTTSAGNSSLPTSLFVKGAKLQFESNSQLALQSRKRFAPCLWRVQSYNLKAIHNLSPYLDNTDAPVCEGCKVTIWKQFTTGCIVNNATYRLFVKGAKLQFESNSQQTVGARLKPATCLWRVQSYNLKAIHNDNSMMEVSAVPVCEGCKVTIWKQFTTARTPLAHTPSLFVKGAKLQFESNSQPTARPQPLTGTCLWRVQSYNLKAIHN